MVSMLEGESFTPLNQNGDTFTMGIGNIAIDHDNQRIYLTEGGNTTVILPYLFDGSLAESEIVTLPSNTDNGFDYHDGYFYAISGGSLRRYNLDGTQV